MENPFASSLRLWAKRSFLHEQPFYKVIKEDFPNFPEITKIEDLTAANCSKMFDIIANATDIDPETGEKIGILDKMCDTKIYNALENVPLVRGVNEREDGSQQLIFDSSVYTKDIYNKIRDILCDEKVIQQIVQQVNQEGNFLLDRKKEKMRQAMFHVAEDIWGDFSNVLNTGQRKSIDEIKGMNEKIDITYKLTPAAKQVLANNIQLELKLEGEKRVQPSEFSTKFRELISDNFIKTQIIREIQRLNGVTMSSQSASDYSITKINPNFIGPLSVKENVEGFISKLKETLIAVYGSITQKEAAYINDIIEPRTRQVLMDETGKKIRPAHSLVLGEKTQNKSIGDMGELLAGVLASYNKNIKVTFAGDIDTKNGQAAVDLYIRNKDKQLKLGFQIKHYPAQESNETIYLYRGNVRLQASGGRQDTRGFTRDENKTLWNDFNQLKHPERTETTESELRDNILKILEHALPLFMRYRQRMSDFDTPKFINKFKDTEFYHVKFMQNNIYVINFKIIPASRIFWELANIQEDSAKTPPLTYLFYEDTKATNSDEESSDADQEETEQEQSKTATQKNLFCQYPTISDKDMKNKFYLNFRGIPIFYRNVKTGGKDSSNILSDVFN